MASRFVVQLTGMLLVLFGFFLKLSVAFILIPDPIFMGILLVNLGM